MTYMLWYIDRVMFTSGVEAISIIMIIGSFQFVLAFHFFRKLIIKIIPRTREDGLQQGSSGESPTTAPLMLAGEMVRGYVPL